MRKTLLVLIFSLTTLCAVWIAVATIWVPERNIPAFAIGAFNNQEFHGGTMFFVGDLMLGRNVELLMNEHGMQYPFAGTSDFLKSHTLTVGNLEGTIPEVHKPTPLHGFTFSFATGTLSVLHDAGFDILSLANNHALDYGEDGYRNTRTLCEKARMECFGHPRSLNENSTATFSVGDTVVGIVFLHTLHGNPDMFTLKLMIEKLSSISDIQIAYIHWGVEYELTHSNDQQNFAHALIDFGVDAVIGHHPHVVQDIELYNNKPIVYSLGNFVFDQYFSPHVMQGLGVQLTIGEESLEYALVPFSNTGSKSSPRIMENEEKSIFFERFTNQAGIDIGSGTYPTMTIPRN